jgi:secreted trypsin-like serine protease
MKTTFVALFGVLGLSVLGGGGYKEVARAIFGDRADARVFPLVLTANHDDADHAVVAISSDDGTCTGTLIAPRYVLTARHCVADDDSVWVSWHTHMDEGARTRARVHLPPSSRGMRDDLAILELATPSSIAPVPVNLSTQSLAGLSHIRVVGYGVSGTNRSDSGVRRSGRSRAVVSGNFVESVRGGEETCYGDSGGPAFAMIDGREQLVGVTSHGTDERCEDGYTRFARTDLHADFLKPFLEDTRARSQDAVAEDESSGADENVVAADDADDTVATADDTIAAADEDDGEDDCTCTDEIVEAPRHVHNHHAKRSARHSRR